MKKNVANIAWVVICAMALLVLGGCSIKSFSDTTKGKAFEHKVIVEAESFKKEDGGYMRIPIDRPATSGGRCIAGWDTTGHSVEWGVEIPETGEYRIALRYAGGRKWDVFRNLMIDGKVPDKSLDKIVLKPTGGFGLNASEWKNVLLKDSSGKLVTIKLEKGKHSIKMVSLGGNGENGSANLDFIAFYGKGVDAEKALSEINSKLEAGVKEDSKNNIKNASVMIDGKEFKVYDNDKLPDDISVIKDVEYGKVGNSSLKLNIIRPKKLSPEPMPVIVYIHGGSWLRMDKDYYSGLMAGFAQQGYVCVNVQHRFSSEAIFPAQIEDCKCAIRFLRAKASEYNIDPDRIGAWGDSSGGHLVNLLGTTGDIEELEGNGGYQGYSSRVQAVCAWYGGADLRGSAPPEHDVSKLLGGTPQSRPELAKKASPITYIKKGLPPFLLMHGDKDTTVPPASSQMLYNNLKNAGVDATLYIVKGAGHGFVNIQEYEMVVKFFNKYLKNSSKS